jgi:hypothetical protein
MEIHERSKKARGNAQACIADAAAIRPRLVRDPHTAWSAFSSVQPVIFKLPSGCRSRV